jgi:hypothetical protein
MLPDSRYQSLQYQLDHEKTQELLSRYVEIQQAYGGAETRYPDVAAHLEVCPVCRALREDLVAPAAAPDNSQPSSHSVVMETIAGGPPARSPIAQTPLDILSREEVVLRVRHVLDAEGNSRPAAGYLLFYDTLTVGKLDLVMMFTLHHSEQPGLYCIRGIISPEQPAVRYKAVLWHSAGPVDAQVEGDRLSFDHLSLGPDTGQLAVTLAVHARWRAGQ